MPNFNFVGVTGIFDGSGIVSGIACTLHSAPLFGSLLIALAAWSDQTSTATMSDDINGLWQPIGTVQRAPALSVSGQLFYMVTKVNTATSVSLDLSGTATSAYFECLEYSFKGTLALDGTPQYSQTPASGSVATISGLTTLLPDDLVLGICINETASGTTAGSGYIGRNDISAFDPLNPTANFQANTSALPEEKTGVNPGAQTATFGTSSGSANVLLALVGFTASIPITYPGDMTPGSGVAWRVR